MLEPAAERDFEAVVSVTRYESSAVSNFFDVAVRVVEISDACD
jgi:hypothetical protein